MLSLRTGAFGVREADTWTDKISTARSELARRGTETGSPKRDHLPRSGSSLGADSASSHGRDAGDRGTGNSHSRQGRADFRFVAANGRTYDPVTATTPEPAAKVLGPGTLVPGVEAVGDVIFDVPNGGGKVTYRSELGGSTLAWPTSS